MHLPTIMTFTYRLYVLILFITSYIRSNLNFYGKTVMIISPTFKIYFTLFVPICTYTLPFKNNKPTSNDMKCVSQIKCL